MYATHCIFIQLYTKCCSYFTAWNVKLWINKDKKIVKHELYVVVLFL